MQESLEEYLKFTKNSKQDESVKISNEMVVTAQIKKECDVRAMKIVEFSIEGRLRPEVFTRCLPFINQAHYQDIVEERAIAKLCGYSLCGKRIPDMPKKQYFISTKSNKVYDITERKNFCSNFCYKASLHIKKQIDNSPLWLRKLECIPEYKLLHPSEGGLPGEFVDQGVVKTVEDFKFTSINDFAQASLGDINDRDVDPGKSKPKKARGFKKPSRLKSTMQTISETEVEEEVAANENSKTARIDSKRSVKIIKKESHKKNCIVSLPSIEENEEKLQSTKENDSGRELNVKIEENVLDDTKLGLKEERLEDTKIQASILEEIQKTTGRTTVTITKCEQIIENNIQLKNEEISIKKEPPEKIPDKSSVVKSKKLIKKKHSSSPKILDIETIVTKSIEDWVTLETCIFIHGEKKVKQVLNEKKLSDYFEVLHVQDLQREQQMRYIDICRRLQLQEMADAKFDKTMTGANKLKPLPDYKRLKEDTKDLKIKVKAFYEGSMYEEDDKNFPAKINNKKNQESEAEEGAPAVLPPVDVNSQNLLRRKIFLSSLSKAIQQLLQSLGASYTAVLSDLQALVKTFRLRADNITFKPLLWNYIALVLLDLLSLKDDSLRELLEERRSQEYIQILFDALPSKKNFVADVLSPVRDIELFVERFITRKNSNNV